MPFTVSNSGTIPSVDQFVQTAGDTQGRIKTSNGNVEKASVNATWRPGATNKQTMKDFRRALEMEYGEAVADHTVAQLNLEGKGPNNRTKALTGALVLAAVREANTQRTTVNGPTSLPQVERGGKRMYMDRNPMNDLRSVVDSAKRIRGAKPDAVPRGLPGRGIYASTGSGGSKHQRAVKQLELLEGLEVLGQQIYGDDVEMRDVFISHVRGNMPAAKFKHEDYSTAASNIKSNLDTCEMTMDDFVTVLEGAQAKCDSFAETRRIDSLFEQYNSLLTTAAEHRDIPAEEVQAMRDQINEAKQLPQDQKEAALNRAAKPLERRINSALRGRVSQLTNNGLRTAATLLEGDLQRASNLEPDQRADHLATMLQKWTRNSTALRDQLMIDYVESKQMNRNPHDSRAHVIHQGKHDAAFEAFAAEAGQLEAIRSFDHIPQSLLHGTDGVGVVDMIGIKREAVKYVASADQNAVDDQMKAALDHFATLEYPSDEDVHQLSKEVQEYDARVRQPLLNGFESAVAATV